MTLDILLKLINLANKNPNENEANSAARKVCKELGSGSFVIRAVEETTPFTNSESPTGRSKPYWWRETPRPKPPPEPKPKEEPKTQYRRAPYARDFYDFDFSGKIYEDFFKRYANKKGESPDSETDPFYKTRRGYEHTGPIHNESRDAEKVCTKCGLKVRTFRKTKPFVCRFCVDK